MTLFDRWLWHVRMREWTSDRLVLWTWRRMRERTVQEWKAGEQADDYYNPVQAE